MNRLCANAATVSVLLVMVEVAFALPPPSRPLQMRTPGMSQSNRPSIPPQIPARGPTVIQPCRLSETPDLHGQKALRPDCGSAANARLFLRPPMVSPDLAGLRGTAAFGRPKAVDRGVADPFAVPTIPAAGNLDWRKGGLLPPKGSPELEKPSAERLAPTKP